MDEITLEKVDIIRERTGASYAEAKRALEACGGNVVDALIFIEEIQHNKTSPVYSSIDEFMNWLKDLISKGNVTRIKIKKDEKVVVDVPVNAGIAVGVIAAIWPPLMAISLITAVAFKVTVEITKDDGSVEIVNSIIKSKMDNIKDKFTDIKDNMKSKFESKDEDYVKTEFSEEPVYKYTVKFDDIDKNDSGDNSEE